MKTVGAIVLNLLAFVVIWLGSELLAMTVAFIAWQPFRPLIAAYVCPGFAAYCAPKVTVYFLERVDIDVVIASFITLIAIVFGALFGFSILSGGTGYDGPKLEPIRLALQFISIIVGVIIAKHSLDRRIDDDLGSPTYGKPLNQKSPPKRSPPKVNNPRIEPVLEPSILDQQNAYEEPVASPDIASDLSVASRLLVPKIFRLAQEISGEDNEAVVSEILKQAGDKVSSGETVAELSIGDSTFEIPSEVSGEVSRIQASVGDVVVEGQILAIVQPDNSQKSAEPSPPNETLISCDDKYENEVTSSSYGEFDSVLENDVVAKAISKSYPIRKLCKTEAVKLIEKFTIADYVAPNEISFINLDGRKVRETASMFFAEYGYEHAFTIELRDLLERFEEKSAAEYSKRLSFPHPYRIGFFDSMVVVEINPESMSTEFIVLSTDGKSNDPVLADIGLTALVTHISANALAQLALFAEVDSLLEFLRGGRRQRN